MVYMQVFVLAWIASTRVQGDESLTFQVLGTTAMSNTFGHIQVDVHYDQYENASVSLKAYLKTAFDTLKELKRRDNKTSEDLRLWRDLGSLPAILVTDINKLKMYKRMFQQVDRNKRQVGAVVGVISLGLSLYNLEELNRISNCVEEATKEVDIIATRVDENSHRIVKIAKDMKAMERIVQRILLSWQAKEIEDHVRFDFQCESSSF